MIQRLYLVGTDHPYQIAHPQLTKKQIAQFRTLLLDACREYGILAVGEEMSREALARCDPKRASSIPALAARQLQLRHRYCDPTWRQRVRLGIPVDNRFVDEEQGRIGDRRREAEWLRRVQRLDKWPLLFICGADHVPGFQEQAECSGINVLVLARDWAAARS